MLKVADFGTSRFLEIAAHGTTVIGSPPYMAPEQFHGKAVFASDIYSLGVTMYQMLTGLLPYDTPAPADIGKLMSGELVSPPRLKNPAIPKVDQRHRAEGDGARVDRALPARRRPARRRARGAQRDARRTPQPGACRRPSRRRAAQRDDAPSIQSRLRARETPGGALLLAVPQAAARPHRSLPVLQRNSSEQATAMGLGPCGAATISSARAPSLL